jgi:hypothetical protein
MSAFVGTSPEELKAFDKTHGGMPARIKHHTGSRWIYADGAVAVHGSFGIDLYEPSSDPRELIFVRREYHIFKLGRTTKGFEHLKAALLGNAEVFHWDVEEYGKPPADIDESTGSPDGMAALRRLQSFVIKHREALAAIDQEVAALPESREAERRRKQNEKLDRQSAEREYAREAEIRKINI